MDKVLEFVSRVGVMKPGAFKRDDKKHAARLEEMLSGTDYAAEEKMDGCRSLIVGHRIFSRDHNEKTDNFPHLRDFFAKLKMVNIILDGEIYYPGKTSQFVNRAFGAKPDTARAFQNEEGYAHLMLYDILRTPKAQWTTENTYKERRKLLQYFYKTFIQDKPIAEYIKIVDMRIHGKKEYLDGLLAEGKEGIVLKRLDSKYFLGKKPMWEWMKVKQEDDADLVIMGFEPPTKNYTGSNLSEWKYWEPEYPGSPDMIPVTENYAKGLIGSVILGAYVDGTLVKICTASGLNQSDRKDMTENPNKYINRVARVTYMEKTTDGYLRHPNYKNLHEDKAPEECVWEF